MYVCGPHRPGSPPLRPRARGARARRAAPLPRVDGRGGPARPQHHRRRGQDHRQEQGRGSAPDGGRRGVHAHLRGPDRPPRHPPPAHRPRATGPHHRDDRAHRGAHRRRPRLRVRRRRLLRRSAPSPSTASCRAARSTSCARVRGSRPTSASATRWTSPCGSGQAGRAELAVPVGRRPAGLAHRVLGHGPQVPRRRLRPPHRRPRPRLPPPRERDRPVRGGDGKPFARHWLHNGLLNIGGEKMSKSVGNVISLAEALDTYGGAVLRFFYLAAHYRSPVELSDDRLAEATAAVERWRAFLRAVDQAGGGGRIEGGSHRPGRRRHRGETAARRSSPRWRTTCPPPEPTRRCSSS
jgi:hypothetical protein